MIGAKSKLEGENAASLCFLWVSGFAMLAAIPMMYIAGAGGSAIAGIIFAIIGLQIGKKYFINKTPTWSELRDAKQKEKKRILDEESGRTAEKSLERLDKKSQFAKLKALILSKILTGTWMLCIQHGDDLINCQLSDNKDSKKIEKIKEATNPSQAETIKLLGFLCAPGETYENIKNTTDIYLMVGCDVI